MSGGATWLCIVMKREFNFDCRLSDYLLGPVTNHRYMSAVIHPCRRRPAVAKTKALKLFLDCSLSVATGEVMSCLYF